MKKALSLILALIMCLSLCACGGGNNTPKTTEPAAEISAAATNAATVITNEGKSVEVCAQDLFDEYDDCFDGLFLMLSKNRSPESMDKNKNLSPAL